MSQIILNNFPSLYQHTYLLSWTMILAEDVLVPPAQVLQLVDPAQTSTEREKKTQWAAVRTHTVEI